MIVSPFKDLKLIKSEVKITDQIVFYKGEFYYEEKQREIYKLLRIKGKYIKLFSLYKKENILGAYAIPRTTKITVQEYYRLLKLKEVDCTDILLFFEKNLKSWPVLWKPLSYFIMKSVKII